MKIYQIDAFAERVFTGNPAAVCPLEQWLSDEQMLKIAEENNLAETAFYVKKDDGYEIRWFTPTIEVDLCGHATLAAAYVLFNLEGYEGEQIQFFSPRSGLLTVVKNGDLLTLNFPSDHVSEIEVNEGILACFDQTPIAAYRGKTDVMLVFENESQILNIKPFFENIVLLKARGIIVTAKGTHVDFVSRFFAPQVGINEDPVTGSAHTTLTPYWADRLGKNSLSAMQLSSRTGKIECKYLGDRTEISGKGKLYLKGEIYIG